MPTPLHRRLWVIVAAALLPTTLLSGVAVMLLHEQRQAEVARATIETMRAMVSAVDGELESAVTVAETLAASHALDEPDLVAFHDEARRVAQAHPRWRTLVLSDLERRPLLNVRQPLGSPLTPFEDRESFDKVVATGAPATGNLSTVDADGQKGFAVRVPVLRAGRVRSVLTIIVSPESMLEVIQKQKVPADGVVSIFDASEHHVARSRSHERYLGQPGAPPLQRLMAGRTEGWGSSVTLEGQDIYAAFSRSADSGWSVVVGIPAGDIDAAIGQSLLTVALGLILSLAAGVLVSLFTARSVIVPIRTLRGAAQTVGRGEVPEVAPMRIAEIHEAAQALVGAAKARRRAESAREELLERERLARAAAEDANRSKDEFLAMLGHELRNPLAAISNAIGVIVADEHAPNASRRRRGQEIIRRQVNHLARLVDDLLDVARVVSGKVSIDPRHLDVAEAARRTVATLEESGLLDRHDVVVETEPAWVHADVVRVEQVINNLLLNAVKYTPDGGTITVRVGTRAERAFLEVADTGDGIGPSLLPQIFDLFTQGKRGLDRSQGGLGIGLTLVRRLVELHDGTVTAASDGEGRGSTFTVELPSVAPPDSAPSAAESAPGNPCDVLIVEDNEDARDMLRALLELAGHHVEVAADGPEGVASALASPPRVALVDLGLPGFDGFEVARRIRAELPGAPITLVALSGYGSEQDRARSKEAGFDLHLVKPVSHEVLLAHVGRELPDA